MKISYGVVLFLLCAAAPVRGQAAPPQSSAPATSQTRPTTALPAQSPIDPAKEADIRHLLDVTGARSLASQTMANMQNSIKPMMTNALPPGEYRAKLIDLFFTKFQAKVDTQHLVDLAVPIYDKYLSDDDIKGLTQFYQTPLGQKTLTVLPKLLAECQEAGRKWGSDVGRQSMLEVLAEHPELEKAMEDTQKARTNQAP